MQDQNIPMKACCLESYASSAHIYIHIMITCLMFHLCYLHPSDILCDGHTEQIEKSDISA